ncbi:hypothetical protein BJY59DRAFT_757241, partial [Rhodotorula toruloides]
FGSNLLVRLVHRSSSRRHPSGSLAKALIAVYSSYGASCVYLPCRRVLLSPSPASSLRGCLRGTRGGTRHCGRLAGCSTVANTVHEAD